MEKKLKRILKKLGWIGFFRLIFSPIFIPMITPLRFFQSLIECKVLVHGKWSQYNRFNSHRAINSITYWIYALNIDKYGFNSYSHTLGDGKFFLGKWFYISLPSIYSYWRFGGAVTSIIGMFGWLAMHFLWLNNYESILLLSVLCIVMGSSVFYANLFEMQNYNAIGWMFFPLGLYGLYTNNYEIATLGWLLVSFGSFTAWFTSGILVFIYSISIFAFEPLLYFLPSFIKIIFHFYRTALNSNLFLEMKEVLKSIGSVEKKSKYVRNKNIFEYFSTVYYLLLYTQFMLVNYYLNLQFDILFLTMIILFILNNMQIIRYADPGSLHMPILSIAIVIILNNFSLWLLVSFIVMINPIALFLNFTDNKILLDIVPKRKPFYIKPLLDEISMFLKIINKNQRCFFAFDNPQGTYEKVFDNQGKSLELALYESSKKEFHLFPDWHLVFQDDSSNNLANFWGRDLKSINQVIEDWNCQYLIYYSIDESEEIFNDKKFKNISMVDWSTLNKKYKLELSEDIQQVKWYLFEVKK